MVGETKQIDLEGKEANNSVESVVEEPEPKDVLKCLGFLIKVGVSTWDKLLKKKPAEIEKEVYKKLRLDKDTVKPAKGAYDRAAKSITNHILAMKGEGVQKLEDVKVEKSPMPKEAVPEKPKKSRAAKPKKKKEIADSYATKH